MSDKVEPKAKKPSGGEVRRTAEERAWDIRRARMRRIGVQFAIAVGLPTLLAIIYYGFWAADEYESDTVIVVQSPSDTSDVLGAGNFVTNLPSDVGLLRNALQSRTMLDALVAKHGWREHYQKGGNAFSRLGDGTETMYGYYRDRLSISAKKGTAVRLSVRAFSAEMAESISLAMLDVARANVNEVALRPIRAQLEIAKKRLAASQEQLESLDDEPAPEPAPAPDTGTPGDPAATTAMTPTRRAQLERDGAADVVQKLEMHLAGQRRYLTVVSGPTRPDQARYPKRLWGIATVFVVSLALMGIFSLLLGALREHAKV